MLGIDTKKCPIRLLLIVYCIIFAYRKQTCARAYTGAEAGKPTLPTLKIKIMTVQEIIERSSLLINGNHSEMSYENIVPCNGANFEEYGNQPCFEFADDFINKYGELEASKTDAPEDEDVPEEIYGKQDRYNWYRVGSGRIVFGILKD